MLLEAVIFDMDGVIIDSEPIHFESVILTMKYYGKEISYEELSKFVGVTSTKMWETIGKNYNVNSSVEKLIKKEEEYKIKLFSNKKLKTIDGISELISDINSRNIKTAVASSSSMNIIELILSNLNLKNEFKNILSGENVQNGKPEPDIFIETAKLLNVEPENCLVIEDSEHGVEAAKKANMKCIGFKNFNSGNQDLSLANVVVTKIEDIDLYKFI